MSETAEAAMQATPRPAPAALLVHIADYVVSAAPPSDVAREAAATFLMESLTRAFDALQAGACARLLGPVVPGATMPRGARVPGTSYELDPVKAAADAGMLFGWPQPGDDPFADDDGRCLPHYILAAPLAVADYLARVALASAREPPTVRDLLRRFTQAHEIASSPAIRCTSTGLGDALFGARLASTAVVTGMFDGSRVQIVAALANAWLDGPLSRTVAGFADGPAGALAMGDAAGRAVSLALRALKLESGGSAATDAADGNRPNEICGGPSVVLDPSLGRGAMTRRHVVDAGAVFARFEKSVTRHFPLSQAGKLTAAFEDRARLEAMPVNELLSLTIRN